MAVIILPDAQDDLLSLQAYLQARCAPEVWLQAEDDIFAKLSDVDSSLLAGPPVPLLADVGVHDYKTVLTSHHRILFRQIDGNTYVYAVAGQMQDFQTLLLKRLFRR